ncbi:MAG TPA: hypothetical protein VEK57_08895 [Thermoanaerobaculia bacterium]|nr:hypothetical protein [Thermoanaerobaculia bacterium]
MRVWSRIALVVVILVSSLSLSAQFTSNCPLSLADSTPPATDFDLSPHGVFRSGNLVFALRGQVLTTYTTNDIGNLQIAREDFIGSLAGRRTNGGVAFSNDMLFISSEAGLEIFDLRNTRAGGTAPTLIHRAAGFHYNRLTVSGSRLAGLFPSDDYPCAPSDDDFCTNQIDIVDISTLTNPIRVGNIPSIPRNIHRGFNDIEFNNGTLIAVSEEGLLAFDITNPAAVHTTAEISRPGKWLVSSGPFIAVGTDTTINVYSLRPGVLPFFLRTNLLVLPFYLGIGRSNPIRFSRNAWFDDTNGRLITLIDEVNPMNQQPARTIAFDVFDFRVPPYEGAVERIYEDVTMTDIDEVKYDPLAAGNYIYVIGETSGIQSWGACGIASGRIELESIFHLTCGGSEIHGWVTGVHKIVNVELFIDNVSLGAATLGGTPRSGVSSPTPVTGWRVGVNLDSVSRGEHQLRAIATDALGVRRQFANKRIFFEGPGRNCVVPRRRAVR